MLHDKFPSAVKREFEIDSEEHWCSKNVNQMKKQGHLSRKNLSRTIFASVNYLSSALVKENLNCGI